MWFRNKVQLDGEDIYEIITPDDHIGFGVAVADIKKSKPHKHYRTKETYVLLSGKLNVYVDGRLHQLNKIGEALKVKVGSVHWAESPDPDNIGRVFVITIPAWTPDDHHLYTC